MWQIVMFDLPVGTKKERKAATDFRNVLLDMGYSMAQFSVYYRVLSGKEVAMRYARIIEGHVPAHGCVNILTVTDKQYENMISFVGRKKVRPQRESQLTLL